MTVSRDNSKAVYQGIKSAGIRFLTALPETWLVYLLQLADDDPEMRLVEVAKEEEAIGIAAGAYFAGAKNALLMQNHGFLASINGIVSLAMLYRIPLLMLIAHRGHFGEPYPWHTQGGIVTEPVIRALGLPFEHARDPGPRRAADPGRAGARVVVARAGRPAPVARPHGGLRAMRRIGPAASSPVKRADCVAALYPELGDRLVVTIMGATAQELYDLGHRETFFYLQHAMGLASSIGLGLALNRPDARVVVLDGDGSVLMNLGGLATLGRYRPANLTHVVFDNESLLSTGGFVSHTASGRTDLAAVARAAGLPAGPRGPHALPVHGGRGRGLRRRGDDDDRRQGRGGRARSVPHGPRAARERVPLPPGRLRRVGPPG